MPPDWIILLFLGALGACVGSFLNVVVYRLPRGLSLLTPPSRCPRCERLLSWRENIPVVGWLLLRGRCRGCREPISLRYPLVEFATAAMFVLTFLALFRWGLGPCGTPVEVIGRLGIPETFYPPMLFPRDAVLFVMLLYLFSSLLAASLIDAEHFVLPLWLCWGIGIVGVVGHAAAVGPDAPGNLVAGPVVSAAALGAALGLLLSVILIQTRWLRRSFADELPLLEHEREALELAAAQAARHNSEAAPPPDPLPQPFTPARLRAEMRLEIWFLAPPMLGAIVAVLLLNHAPSFGSLFETIFAPVWVRAAMGSIFGAMIGGLTVWTTRILGTIAFGREAMGLGDVHLMFGVGAVIGAMHAVVAFFIAPFFGLALALYMLLRGKRRELPYGPYLALGSVAAMMLHCRIQHHPSIHALTELFTLYR